MDELRLNLLNETSLNRILHEGGFLYPRGGRPADMAAALRAALRFKAGSVGAAVVGSSGELEPAASGEGLGWGRDGWDNLDSAPADDATPGLCLRYFGRAHEEWRWGLDFRTGRVAQCARVFKMRGC